MSDKSLLKNLTKINQLKLTNWERIFTIDMEKKINFFSKFKGNQRAKVIQIIEKHAGVYNAN